MISNDRVTEKEKVNYLDRRLVLAGGVRESSKASVLDCDALPHSFIERAQTNYLDLNIRFYFARKGS